jgi:hypothetical protein
MMVPSTASNAIPRGLGALGDSTCWSLGDHTYKVDCSGGKTNGQLIDCACFSNLTNSTCWNMCTPSVVAPGAGTAPSDPGGADSGGSSDDPPLASGNTSGGFFNLTGSAVSLAVVGAVGLGLYLALRR